MATPWRDIPIREGIPDCVKLRRQMVAFGFVTMGEMSDFADRMQSALADFWQRSGGRMPLESAKTKESAD